MGHANGVFSGQSADYHLKEFECLRKEIEILIDQISAIERYVIVAVGVTWGWIWDKKPQPWAYFIPVLFAVLGAIRSRGMNNAFNTFHGYISELEEAFSKPDGPAGWEHFLARQTQPIRYEAGSGTFWTILIVATSAVAILHYFKLL